VTHTSRSFTFIEVLIVMVILAILASIVLGDVQDAVVHTREAALIENLGRMRAMIERWAFHHGGQYPKGNESVTPGDEESGEESGEEPREEPGGGVDAGETISHLAGVELPVCTVAENRGKRTIHIVDTTGQLEPDPSPETGWKYSTATGQFICNSVETGTNDIPYARW